MTNGARCQKCGVWKEADAFYKRSASPNGLQPNCKECEREYAKGYYARNRDRYRIKQAIWAEANREYKREWHKANYLRKTWGLTFDQLNEMIEAQKRRCAVCSVQAELVIDHDHASGRIRGLLCQPCNKGLGHFHDDPEMLEAAAQYLRASASVPREKP